MSNPSFTIFFQSVLFHDKGIPGRYFLHKAHKPGLGSGLVSELLDPVRRGNNSLILISIFFGNDRSKSLRYIPVLNTVPYVRYEPNQLPTGITSIFSIYSRIRQVQ